MMMWPMLGMMGVTTVHGESSTLCWVSPASSASWLHSMSTLPSKSTQA